MTLRLVDSHAHIGEEAFDEDRAGMMARARAAGVEHVVVIGYDLDSSRRAIELASDAGMEPTAEAPGLSATAGFAPHNVADADPEARAAVRELLSEPAVVAVGEIGLDYHYDMPRPEQRALFHEQLGWAVESGLPVVIHSREAEEDVIAGLERHGAGEDRLRGVIHCFTESVEMAHRVVQLGFRVSFSGIVTFKNAPEIRAAAEVVPLERTLIETDSPYLAPVPHRGKRNEPAFVADVARFLAELHGVSPERLAEVTAANARELFRLP